jgi:hypothetical protein
MISYIEIRRRRGSGPPSVIPNAHIGLREIKEARDWLDANASSLGLQQGREYIEIAQVTKWQSEGSSAQGS